MYFLGENLYIIFSFLDLVHIATKHIPYAYHHNLLENKEMVIKNGIKNIQAKGYHSARTVHKHYKYYLSSILTHYVNNFNVCECAK
jgi:hypothetical protein